jgi:hypothetical protein
MTNSEFGHKYMPITSSSMYEYPYTSASMGDSPYIPTASQSYYDGDDNDGMRSQFRGPHAYTSTQANYAFEPSARTAAGMMDYMYPSNTTMIAGMGGGVASTRFANNMARGCIAGGVGSLVYSVADGLWHQRVPQI